jgi:hypothetical protein
MSPFPGWITKITMFSVGGGTPAKACGASLARDILNWLQILLEDLTNAIRNLDLLLEIRVHLKAKGGTKMVDVKMPHPQHEEHLCFKQNVGFLKSNLEDYKKLVRNGKFVCKNCGRVAAKEESLCSPEKL